MPDTIAHIDVDSALTMVNRGTAIGAVLLIYVLLRHVFFFARAKSNQTASIVKWLFVAEVIASLSILSFSGLLFFITPEYWSKSPELRVATKLFQFFSVYLTLWASYRFGKHYRRIK